MKNAVVDPLVIVLTDQTVTSTIDTAEILLDALKSIQLYKDQTIVIGLAGTSFENEELRRQLLQDIHFLATVGARPVVVHGGSVSAEVYVQNEGLNASQEIAGDLNKMLADEYEAIGGRAMTLNFDSGAVLFGDPATDQPCATITSLDRIVVDNLCYAGQTPIIPAMLEGPSNEQLLCDEVISIPFIAAELAAHTAVIVGHESTFKSICNDQKLNISMGNALNNGVESFHLINASFSHGLLLQLFSQQRPGIVIGKSV